MTAVDVWLLFVGALVICGVAVLIAYITRGSVAIGDVLLFGAALVAGTLLGWLILAVLLGLSSLMFGRWWE